VGARIEDGDLALLQRRLSQHCPRAVIELATNG